VTKDEFHGPVVAFVVIAGFCLVAVASVAWWSPCLENCDGHTSFARDDQLFLALGALGLAFSYWLAAWRASRLSVPLLLATLAMYVAWLAVVAH
jgi:hypothetical protein